MADVKRLEKQAEKAGKMKEKTMRELNAMEKDLKKAQKEIG